MMAQMERNRLFCRRVILALLITAASAQSQDAQKQAADTDTNTAVDAKNKDYIRLWRSIMAPKDVADAFGHRIATHYIAMQITIANRNKDYQWLIQKAAIDVGRLVKYQQGRKECAANTALLFSALEAEAQSKNPAGDYMQVSSADLTVLRGTAEKGQSLDPRNLAVRSLTGAGVIAAGLIGVTSFGHSYAPAVAAFNGPFLTAVQQIFPDYTVGQMNRLNDSAFLTNTVVGKQQARVVVILVRSAHRQAAEGLLQRPGICVQLSGSAAA